MNHFNSILSILLFSATIFAESLSISQEVRGAKHANTSVEIDNNINKVHGLLVGISDYLEVPSLDYADNDAELMSNIIANSFSGKEGKIISLTNEKATEYTIISSMIQLNKVVEEGDLVVIYLAGHGDVAEGIDGNKEGYFLAQDASASREYELGGSISFKKIIKFINGLTAKKIKVWLITDACRSGKIIDAQGASSTLTALINGYQNTTKFISCQANELSYEYDSLAHGVFTYYFAKGISGEADTDEVDGIISVEELNRYLTSKVRSVTNKQQTPNVHASDKYAELFAADLKFKSFLKNQDLAYSGTGKKRGEDPNELKKSSTMIAFEDAIIKGELYGNSRSALEIYKSNKSKLTQKELDFMKDMLVNTMLQRVQYITNIFLNGRPTIGKNEDYITAFKDLEHVLKLIDTEHPLRKNLENRKQFFRCMDIIKNLTVDKFELAESELLRIEKEEENATYIHQGLAMLYVAENDLPKAEEYLKKAAQKIETWSKPKNSMTHLDIVKGNLNEAEKRIASTLELKNNKDNALILKAHLYHANYQLQLAEKALNEVTSEQYSASEMDQLEARTNELRGRITVAKKQYMESLSNDKDNVDLLLKLAELSKENGDTLEAITYYQAIVEKNNKHTIAQANIDLLKGDKTDFNWKGVNLNSAASVTTATSLLEEEKKYTDAIELLNAAIEIMPWNLDILFELSKQQYNSGDSKTSVETLKQILGRSPYHFKSIRSLALIYLHQGKNREAEILIQKYMPYFENSSKYLSLSYTVYQHTGANRDLYVILEKAIALDSLDTDPYKGLYQLHISNSLYSEASREFNNLIRIGGGYKDSLDFYSRLESQVKEMLSRKIYEGQMEGVQLMLELDRFNYEMVYWLAFLQYLEGDYATANKTLRAFGKDIAAFSPGVQRQYYHLKAKINLEMEDPALAERLFGMSASGSIPPDYLGLAMSQFEQGKRNWIDNFRRGGMIEDFSPDAQKRYNKMLKKAKKMKPPSRGGVRQNR